MLVVIGCNLFQVFLPIPLWLLHWPRDNHHTIAPVKNVDKFTRAIRQCGRYMNDPNAQKYIVIGYWLYGYDLELKCLSSASDWRMGLLPLDTTIIFTMLLLNTTMVNLSVCFINDP